MNGGNERGNSMAMMMPRDIGNMASKNRQQNHMLNELWVPLQREEEAVDVREYAGVLAFGHEQQFLLALSIDFDTEEMPEPMRNMG